eukprot:scaffold222421_cov16-Tisochrysis_lutea.AAC.2
MPCMSSLATTLFHTLFYSATQGRFQAVFNKQPFPQEGRAREAALNLQPLDHIRAIDRHWLAAHAPLDLEEEASLKISLEETPHPGLKLVFFSEMRCLRGGLVWPYIWDT